MIGSHSSTADEGVDGAEQRRDELARRILQTPPKPHKGDKPKDGEKRKRPGRAGASDDA